MLKLRKFGVVLGAMAMFATSTFADHRPRNESGRGERYDQQSITAQGRVTALHREGDGYRLQLDQEPDWYYVPSHGWRSRDRELRVGLLVRLGGGYHDSRGWVHCDWADDRYGFRDGYSYGTDFVSGTIQRIDYHRGMLQLRDERTGRWITVDMRGGADHCCGLGRVDVNHLRCGNYVELEGEWVGGGVFRVHRIDVPIWREWGFVR